MMCGLQLQLCWQVEPALRQTPRDMMYTRGIYVWCVADRTGRAVKTLRDELLSGGIFKWVL